MTARPFFPRVALSLRQPWAWVVVHGGKNIENRKWPTKFRGPFLVHAAKGMTRDEYEDAVDFAHDVDPTIIVPEPKVLDRGGIVGVASVVGCIAPCCSQPPSLFSTVSCKHPWHMPGQFGFLLADVAPLPFTPCRGMLGFFRVDDAVVAELERQVGGARW